MLDIVIRAFLSLWCPGEARAKLTARSAGALLLVILLLAGSTVSAEAVKKIKGPIVITSEKLTADNQAHTTLFEKAVTARTREIVLYANSMLVYSDAKTGDVTRIDAKGDVRLVRNKRVVTSSEATY